MIYLCCSAASAFVAVAVAISKRRSAGRWLALGLLIPVFAVVAIALLPSLEPDAPYGG